MIVELRSAIGDLLESVHDNVYFERATDRAPMPYIVYELTNSYHDGTMENVVLEVDGWDAPPNGETRDLEDMMERVNSILNKKVIHRDGYVFICYLDNRMNLHDDEKLIRRRKYRYQVRTFGGE